MPTILLVEDNPTNLKLIRDILTFQKYDLIEATTVKWRLQKLKKIVISWG